MTHHTLKSYLHLMRFHKPVGTFLLLWPTLWSLWIAAKGMPSVKNLIIFILGVIVMRAAGCVINDVADRKFDCNVPRTKDRPITAGELSVRSALMIFGMLCLIAFVLVLFTNLLTIMLAMGALVVAIVYPFAKRFTHWPQLVLGIAFSFSIPMAFAAEINHIPATAFILMLANIVWTIAYDTEYAMADRENDRKIGIKSTAILFGKYDRGIIGGLQGCFLILLLIVGRIEKLSGLFFVSVGLGFLLFVYQQVLIYKREPDKCLAAFLNNQWVGLVVFLFSLPSISF